MYIGAFACMHVRVHTQPVSFPVISHFSVLKLIWKPSNFYRPQFPNRTAKRRGGVSSLEATERLFHSPSWFPGVPGLFGDFTCCSFFFFFFSIVKLQLKVCCIKILSSLYGVAQMFLLAFHSRKIVYSLYLNTYVLQCQTQKKRPWCFH